MKKKFLIRGFLVLVIFLAIGFFVFQKLGAQRGAAGLVVHPSNLDLSIDPSIATNNTITLDNVTDQTLTIRVDKRNFTAQGEEGDVNLTNQDTSFSLASWISVTPSEITIPAHSSQKFIVIITPPSNAEPGGHFGSVVFATVPPKNTKGVGAALSEEVASLILARIPGNVKEQATVETFTTDKNFYEFGPVNFDVRVKNQGGVHVKPSGEIVVTDMFGGKAYLPFTGLNVLPNSIRRMPDTLSKKLLIGNYTAELIAVYGTKNEQLNASTTFSGFPVRYALVALVILIILFLFRRRLGKALKAIITGK